MTNKGLVSIIMPTYNCAKYISKSIESVINQTYTDWELIVIDDCSQDDTEIIVSSFNEKRILYYKNKKNRGAAYSRNFAINQARGKWMAFLDSDDLWCNDKLEKQILFMLNNGYHFSCTKRSVINEKGNKLNITVSSPEKVGIFLMHCYCWLGCLTVMYDSEYIGKIQIDECLKKNNDYAMWLKVVKKTPCYYLDEELAFYRVRKNSISHDKFLNLLSAHYILFRKGEKRNAITSIILTILNCICGFWKKMHYVTKKSGGEEIETEI